MSGIGSVPLRKVEVLPDSLGMLPKRFVFHDGDQMHVYFRRADGSFAVDCWRVSGEPRMTGDHVYGLQVSYASPELSGIKAVYLILMAVLTQYGAIYTPYLYNPESNTINGQQGGSETIEGVVVLPAESADC